MKDLFQKKYKKSFTRDFTLALLDVWYKSEAKSELQWSGQRQPYQPYIVFHRHDGTVTSYYDDEGIKWIKDHIKKYAQRDNNFLKILEKNLIRKLAPIQPLYENECLLSKNKLVQFINNFEDAYSWVVTMWWLCHMHDDNELVGLNIADILKLRAKTEKLSAGTDIVVRKSLSEIFPALKDFIHVLTMDEIKKEKFPSVSILKKRHKGYFYTDERLFLCVKKEDIEKEYGIVLESEKVNRELSEIKGMVAYRGKVVGNVRIVNGYGDIDKVLEGDVLVSPMTMPAFILAMKNAAAFITDEGGITCHAAIVARELKKPCIIGTKVATDILKDGDLVEVDADKGTVKIIQRKNEMYAHRD